MRRVSCIAPCLLWLACAAAGGREERATRPAPDGSVPTAACPVVPRPDSCILHGPWTRALDVQSPARVRIDPSLPKEGYEANVGASGVEIRAGSAEGAFRAETTLKALRSSDGRLPYVTVRDAPRFSWRGLHLDVARHFFAPDAVFAIVDRMVLLKLDVLHLHLSDDQGFRLAVEKHPELTAVGAYRSEPAGRVGGFYSADDVRAIVAYARARFVTIVPEIDVPGHVTALLASHPELSCTGGPFKVPSTWGIFEDVLCVGNDATFALIGDILDAVVALFPGPWVHVGGDEVPGARWSACPKCRARMKAEGLASAHELQGWFSKKVAAMVRARGKTPIGWDEMLDTGLPQGAVAMVWRSREVGLAAARAGRDVIMVPNDTSYLDMKQSGHPSEPGAEGRRPWTRVFSFDPAPASLEPAARAHVLGGQVALWTEYVTDLAQADLLLFPRAAAAAEVLWSSAHASEDDFADRMRGLFSVLDRSGVGYFVAPPEGLAKKTVFIGATELRLAPPALHRAGRVLLDADGKGFAPYVRPLAISATTTARAVLELPNGRRSPILAGAFVKELPRVARALPLGPTGALYNYVEGPFDRVPALGAIAPLRKGAVSRIERPPGRRSEDYAVRFEARFVAKETGVYRFIAVADDGIIVSLDGERVVDDDGVHGPREAPGEIALEAGAHDLLVDYFQGKGGDALDLFVEGPGLARRRVEGELLRQPP